MAPGHHAVLIKNLSEASYLLQEIGADPKSFEYMVPKTVHFCIKLKSINCRAALIIKQEMLSRGGEAAIRREALLGQGSTDILLMGTIKQYNLLIQKLKQQSWSLPALAAEIELILAALEVQEHRINLKGNRQLIIGNKTLIMGILNITPDSFFDGGRFARLQEALDYSLKMMEYGADIIDVGGASSRPNSLMVDEAEELKRVLPVVKQLARQKDIVISVDTFRAGVARACLEAGAHMINDIGGLHLDKELAPVLAEHKAAVVLMHNRLQQRQGVPYSDLIADIIQELKDSLAIAQDQGLNREQIIVDPGVGFGKSLSQNRSLIKNWWQFKSLGLPTLLGASRKAFIGQTLGLEKEERLEGSLAVLAMGIMNGADIVRVHDVEASVRVARMVDAVLSEEGL